MATVRENRLDEAVYPSHGRKSMNAVILSPTMGRERILGSSALVLQPVLEKENL